MAYFIRAACLNDYDDIVRSYGQNRAISLKRAGIIQTQLRDPDTLFFMESFFKSHSTGKEGM